MRYGSTLIVNWGDLAQQRTGARGLRETATDYDNEKKAAASFQAQLTQKTRAGYEVVDDPQPLKLRPDLFVTETHTEHNGRRRSIRAAVATSAAIAAALVDSDQDAPHAKSDALDVDMSDDNCQTVRVTLAKSTRAETDTITARRSTMHTVESTPARAHVLVVDSDASVAAQEARVCDLVQKRRPHSSERKTATTGTRVALLYSASTCACDPYMCVVSLCRGV
jgi:hypothetical protein